jgi:hypothetical protein
MDTQAPVAPGCRPPWTVAVPVPAASVVSAPTAVPGSPIVQVRSAGRGTWMSLTLYRVLGAAVARRTSAFTRFEFVLMSADALPVPVGETQRRSLKSQALKVPLSGTKVGPFDAVGVAAAVPTAFTATTAVATAVTAAKVPKRFDRHTASTVIVGCDNRR